MGTQDEGVGREAVTNPVIDDSYDWPALSVEQEEAWDTAWTQYYDREKKRPVHKTSVTEMTYKHTNGQGSIHGGELMKLMDTLAGLTAKDYAESDAVTVATAPIHFNEPVEVGDILSIEAAIHDAGYSSMTIHVDVFVEDYFEQDHTPATETYYTFVAIDEGGNPTPVPRLDLETATEHEQARRARTMKTDVKALIENMYDASG